MKKHPNGINKKNKFMQLFCKHKNIGTFGDQQLFQSLSGEWHYHICKDCGKQTGKQFLKYEGGGFK